MGKKGLDSIKLLFFSENTKKLFKFLGISTKTGKWDYTYEGKFIYMDEPRHKNLFMAFMRTTKT